MNFDPLSVSVKYVTKNVLVPPLHVKNGVENSEDESFNSTITVNNHKKAWEAISSGYSSDYFAISSYRVSFSEYCFCVLLRFFDFLPLNASLG